MHTFTRETLPANVNIFVAGEVGHSAYVIEDGCVEVLREHSGGWERIALLAAGAMFGEVALLDHDRRTATVRTLLPTRLIRIEREQVENLLKAADPVVQHLVQLLLTRFRHAQILATNLNLPPDQPRLRHSVDVQAAALRTLSLSSDLMQAIRSQQLTLAYQPLLDLHDGRIAGVEALVRWRHPTEGPASPAEFIPMAEKTGLIHEIGRWVLLQSTADWPRVREFCEASATTRPFLSINFAAPELCRAGIVESILAALLTSAMAPEELHVELTETSLVGDFSNIAEVMAQLRAIGIGVALDDFGTGYAGLDYLQALPFSCIKIDMSFVRQMASSERSYHIVKSALTLANTLGMTTIAEGIEDAATATALRAMGCRLGQGYYLGKPMALDALAEWAATTRRARSAP